MDRAPWLVVGADGAIGGELLRKLQSDSIPSIGTSRRPGPAPEKTGLDLTAEPSHWVLPERVEIAFLCAAVTSIEKCRLHPEETRRVNVERTFHLAEQLRERRADVVFLSTNQVFDGTRPHRRGEEPTCPLTEYGRQKAVVESELLRGTHATVVRFTKVVPQRMKLIDEWSTSLKAGHAIRPFHDMLMSPVPLTFAAEVLKQVGSRKPGGIVQVSGERDVSYAEVAERLARRLDVNPNLVQAISVEQAGIGRDAAPENTTLDTMRLSELDLRTPSVTETIDALIEGAIRE